MSSSRKRKLENRQDPTSFGQFHASEWRLVPPQIANKYPYLADARQLLFTPICKDQVKKRRLSNDGATVIEETEIRTRTLGDMLAYNFLAYSTNNRKYALVRQYNREGEEAQPLATQVELQTLTSQGKGLDVVQLQLVAPKVFEDMLLEDSRALHQFDGDVDVAQANPIHLWMDALISSDNNMDNLIEIRNTRIKEEAELVKKRVVRVQQIVGKREKAKAEEHKQAAIAKEIRKSIEAMSDPKERKEAEKIAKAQLKAAKQPKDSEVDGKLLNPNPTPVHVLDMFFNSAFVPIANGFRMFDPGLPLHLHRPLEDYAGWNIDSETGVVRFFVGPETEHLMDDKTITQLFKDNPDKVLQEAQWFLRQYFDVICGSNKALWWWEMAKIELSQRCPELKSGKVTLSVGTFGIGKSLLLEIMICDIIGYESRIGMKCSSAERAGLGSSRFGGDFLKFSRAVVIEEWHNPKDNNAFKNAVTEVKQQRENKFEKETTANEYTNFWGSANNIPWLEWNQRRLVLFSSRLAKDFDVSRVLKIRKDRRVLALIRAITCGLVFELGLQEKAFSGHLEKLQWRDLNSSEYLWSETVAEGMIKKAELENKSSKFKSLMEERALEKARKDTSQVCARVDPRLRFYDAQASQLIMIHPLTPLMACAYVQQLHKTNAIGHYLLSEVFDRLRVNSIQFASGSSNSTSEFLKRVGDVSGSTLLESAKTQESNPLPNYVLFEETMDHCGGQTAKFVWPLRDQDYQRACELEQIPYAADFSRSGKLAPKTVNGKQCYPIPLSQLGRLAAMKAQQRLKFSGEISERANEQAHMADENATLAFLNRKPVTIPEKAEFARRVMQWLNKAFTYGRAETATTLDVFPQDEAWPVHFSYNDGSNEAPQTDRFKYLQEKVYKPMLVEKLQKQAGGVVSRAELDAIEAKSKWNPRVYSHWVEEVAVSPVNETKELFGTSTSPDLRSTRERPQHTRVVFLPAGLWVAIGYMQSFKSEAQLLQFPVFGPEMDPKDTK